MIRTITETAPSLDIGELTIVFDHLGWASYFGTRMQIEAEGIRPPNDRWPDGFGRRCWSDNGNYFHLTRSRPEGAKGARREFIDCDHWELRISREDRDLADYEIFRRERELRAIKFHRTPAGQAEFQRGWDALIRAHNDSAFQSFKAGIPALAELHAKRGRKPRKDRTPPCEL